MSSIQDIHSLKERIFDIVDGYVKGDYSKDDVLALGYRCGKIIVDVDSNETIKTGRNTELYSFRDLVCIGDDGNPEVDNDRISDIANSWLFLD